MEWVLSDSMPVRLFVPMDGEVSMLDSETCDLDSSTHIGVVKSRRIGHGKVCITHGGVKRKACIMFGNLGRCKHI
jgi:hypothetical protein